MVSPNVKTIQGSKVSNRFRYVRWFSAVVLMGLGVALLMRGWELQSHPRDNADDDLSLTLMAIGTSLIGGGASLPFVPSWLAIAIGLVSPVVAYVSAVVVFWTIVILSAFFHYL